MEAVAQRLRAADISCALVGEPGELISIITERDLVDALARGLPADTAVGVVSVANPLTASTDETLWEAGARMLDKGVRHLVVTMDNRAVAVVSMRDVVGGLIATPVPDAAMAVIRSAVAERPEFWLG
jgi:CBS domain-containing protein